MSEAIKGERYRHAALLRKALDVHPAARACCSVSGAME